jgi:hypothetical protein
MNITSGGLTIAMIAAIWFLVFLPSFIKADAKNPSRNKVEATSRDLTSAKLGDKASRAIKARRGRTLLAALALGSLSISVLSFLEFATVGSGLVLGIGTGLASVVLISLTVRNHRKYQTLVQDAVRRTIVFTRPSIAVKSLPSETNATAWQPTEVPKQGFLKTGAIEIVNLAEVVELDSRPDTSETSSLDEIMRRRRHIG